MVAQGPLRRIDGRQPPEASRKQRPRAALAAFLLAAVLVGACGGRAGRRVKLPPPINPRVGWSEVGTASWYGHPYHGRKTSNGETYDMNRMTAAHKRLPFDTWLRVENLANGERTQVRINDRGPFVGRRIIDLSRAAAADIDMIVAGTARVRLTVIRPPRQQQRSSSGQPGRGAEPPSERSAGRFDIQVGFFSSRANAASLAQRVAKRGHQADVLPSGGSYRVVVRGGNLKQANERLRVLKRQGIDGFLRPRRD